jgi:peptidoglycan LD-endopeptidase CwlK
MSRLINALSPQTAQRCQDFILRCRAANIDVIITSTYRSKEEQDQIYAVGRTIPGKIVTNAKGGYSFHQYRCAFDFVPVIHSKAQWDNIELINKCGEIGEACGLEWAGRWKRFKERLHFQDTQGLTLADLQNGKKVA